MNGTESKKIANDYILAIYESNYHEIYRLEEIATANFINLKNFLQTELFSQVIGGNLLKIRALVGKAVNLNAKLNGTTVLHEACSRSYISIVEYLLTSTGVYINPVDGRGRYPLTIACENNCIPIVRLLLNHETIRVSRFNDYRRRYYNKNLDVIKISIQHGYLDLLNFLLQYSLINNTPIFVNLYQIEKMIRCAIYFKQRHIEQQLRTYTQTLRQGGELFSAEINNDLHALLNDSQSISHVDSATIISVLKLCKRYNITVKKHGAYRKLFSDVHDFKKLFESLKGMIERSTGNCYKIFYSAPNHDGDEYRIISDEEYQDYAMAMYNSIAQGQTGRYGSYNAYKSYWYIEGTEQFVINAGISVIEAWALAVLAVRDKHAISGKEFTDQDIADREQILVRSLVECQRTYNCNNEKQLDFGGESEPSCLHGIFDRPLFNLTKLHDDINIGTSSFSWAMDIARELVENLYMNDGDKKLISHCISCSPFQLTIQERHYLNRFYAIARKNLETELNQKIGLISQSGYLTKKEMKDILDSIESISLPLAMNTEYKKNSNFQHLDYERIATGNVLIENQIELEQRKLPFTSDSVYAAVLISAINQGYDISDLHTISKLRNRISGLINLAVSSSSKFFYESNLHALKSSTITLVVCRTIKQYLSNILGSDNVQVVNEYIKSVGSTGAADILVISLLAAVFDATIAIYNYSGEHVVDISAQPLFLSPKSVNRRLNIALRVAYMDHKPCVDYNYANALIKSGSWDEMSRLVSELSVSNIETQLAGDENIYEIYQPMLGRSVLGFQQIKIPADGNCCFNAVLVAARSLGVTGSFAIRNHFELRQLVQKELESRLETALNAVEPDGYNEFLNNIYAAIDEFNELNNEKIVQPRDYIAAIGKLGTWGGHLELQIMSNILEINIHIYVAGSEEPQIIKYANANKDIILHHIARHYNVLMNKGLWLGLESNDSILEFEKKPKKQKSSYKMGV